jgi:rare lipoprotein A
MFGRNNAAKSKVIGRLPIPSTFEIRHYLTSAILGAFAIISYPVAAAHACSPWNGQKGVASYYGPGLQGNRTANGDRFNMWAMTAAHPCMPMGTKIRVTVLGTGRSLIVTVNDRLPSRRRILDLSLGAARVLGITAQGVARVQLSPG